MKHEPAFSWGDAWKMLLIGLTLFVVSASSLLGIESGQFPTSSGNRNPHEHSEFALEVAANGQTVFTVAEGVSEELREELLKTVYPSPAAAEAAAYVEPPTTSMRAWWWPYFSIGEPAYAHAVLVCTKSPGKVSHETGGGRHLTKWRGDWDGKRHTRTFHQVLNQNGYWLSYATYNYHIKLRYC